MKELTEVAAKYAAEKTNALITDAVAKAYTDGYRDGYKDKEEEISIDLRSNGTEYVDLGLPSGTLWAKDYEKGDDKKIVYLPYQKTVHMQLPTEEQWKELLEICEWYGDYSSSAYSFYGIKCIGPNGNSIKFSSKGYIKEENPIKVPKYGGGQVFFWLSDDKVHNEKKAIHISGGEKRVPQKEIANIFSGYKLPVRLVRTK